MRYIVPIILLLISIASFVMYTDPAYKTIQTKRALVSQYDEALSNATTLQKERDALNDKYLAIPPASLARLNKLLPDNADNIRLIIDIQQMAQSYGMSLSAIKFDSTQTGSAASGQLSAGTPADVAASLADYGTFNLTFATTASYDNFLKFLKDVESSLRLTDIQSIEFSAGDVNKATYTYTVKLKTYWLKS